MRHTPPIPATPTERGRILVVDDSVDSVDMLVQFLSEKYTVTIASNGMDALEAARADLPDLILLDVVMPGMDGHEVCRQLKRDERTMHIPVIFVTASHNVTDEIDGFELGAADFIAKPFSHLVVERRVLTQIELKRSRDALAKQAVAEERARIRRDFHDSQAQTLAAASIHLEALFDCVSPVSQEASRHLDRVRQLLRSGLLEAQHAIENWHPHRLESLGLEDALLRSGQELTEDSAIVFNFHVSGMPSQLPVSVRTNLYLLAQEAMANAVRHGSPACLDCELAYLDDGVALTVRDDGEGFDVTAEHEISHRGLRNARDRVSQLGGDLTIESAVGAGTVLIATLPC